MGSWFSNLHIRKNGKIEENSVVEYICDLMTKQKYAPVETEAEADGIFAILSANESQWYSVYADLFSFEDPKRFAEYATPMSEKLETDVLGISCFDSDYLFLNIINGRQKVDAWAGIGRGTDFGIRKQTNLTAWKSKVNDFDSFKKSIKKKYVFAEEVLADVEQCLHLPQKYGIASLEILREFEINGTVKYLYFRLPEDRKGQEPTVLVQRTASLMPCFLNEPSIVEGINIGGASQGLSVYFVGPYVENEEITFSDVCFIKRRSNHVETVPFALEKVQLSDGQWAYYYHDPGYRIPAQVDDRLPMQKRMQIENERSIIVRFVPHGNPRKILDIAVALVPDRNPQGQTGWNVWHQFGSKETYIQFYNNTWSKHPGAVHSLLREEDFD